MNSSRWLVLSFVLAALLPRPADAAAYALCIIETPARIAARTDPKTSPTYWSAFAAFGDSLKAAGVLRGGSAFDTSLPSRSVQPGQSANQAKIMLPTADTFSGYFVIEVNTEAEALAWAARVPNPGGFVEVHPLLSTMAK